MLVFLVAMVCIIRIPHLPESPALSSSCWWLQSDTCQSPREARAGEATADSRRQRLSFQAKTCLKCWGYSRALPLSTGRRLILTLNKATTACSKTLVIVCKPEKLGSAHPHCTQKVQKMRCHGKRSTDFLCKPSSGLAWQDASVSNPLLLSGCCPNA